MRIEFFSFGIIEDFAFLRGLQLHGYSAELGPQSAKSWKNISLPDASDETCNQHSGEDHPKQQATNLDGLRGFNADAVERRKDQHGDRQGEYAKKQHLQVLSVGCVNVGFQA